MASESYLVELGHDFATSTGTLAREVMSELSVISTENVATTRSPTNNSMMHGLTEKTPMSSSLSERVKNVLGNFFPFTMGTGTGDEAETQEEEDDDDEIDDFESQVSLKSSTHENGASTNSETSSSDQFGVVWTINKTIDGRQQARKVLTMTNLEVQPGKKQEHRVK